MKKKTLLAAQQNKFEHRLSIILLISCLWFDLITKLHIRDNQCYCTVVLKTKTDEICYNSTRSRP